MQPDSDNSPQRSNVPATRRVFVSGGTGVIGRAVVRRLLRDGHSVTVLARSPEQHATLTAAGITACEASLFDRESLVRAFDGHDIVINLATNIPRSSLAMMMPGAWRTNDRIRKEGSAKVLYAAQRVGVQTYVQESFAPIYEGNGAQWIDETCAVRPVRYNRTTRDAEASALAFTANGGRGIVLRFAGFYGPDALNMREFVRMVRMGWAPIPGSLDAYWSSIHHEDASASVVAALDAPAGIYNVTDDEPLPRHEFSAALADAFALKHPRSMPQWMTKMMGSAGELFSRSQRMSNRKFRSVVKWAPEFPSVREGFRELAGRWRAT